MDFMLALAGILLLAILFLYISQVFKIPSIVSFLVIGMLAGPLWAGAHHGRIIDRDHWGDCRRVMH